MTELKSFIDEAEIEAALQQKPDKNTLLSILERCKSTEHKGLTLPEVALLLNNTDPQIDHAIFDAAKHIKKFIYGNRMVLFAPLYVNNLCDNNCLYCGFRHDNKKLERMHLTRLQIAAEVRLIEEQGHKRLLMVYGENESYPVAEMVEDIKAAYRVRTGQSGEIRRINMNIAPLSTEDFKTLATAGIGTFQCFQETYHQETYKKLHISGKKSDYLWRLYAHHRAMDGGIEDIGMGVLLGIAEPKFDVLALIKHAQVLEKEKGVGPHTISFPRVEPALDTDVAYNPPYALSDDEFKRIVAITRLALPYVGMIISTREGADIRMELLELGISQISAGSRVSPGGYEASKNVDTFTAQQFQLNDTRSLDQVVYDMAVKGYIPSFCTGCYRKKRVGEHFMGLAKKAFIKDFCTPNAIFTFAEYLRDYASPKTKEVGYALIKKLVAENKEKDAILKGLEDINAGANDIFN